MAVCRDVYEREPLVDELVTLLSNEEVAPQLWLADFLAPRIASTVRPGQFVHVRIPDFDGHVLRRPFSVGAWSRGEGRISILYQTVGKGTRKLSEASADTVTNMIGPIGRGWNPPQGIKKALLVCGGVGVAPLMMLARELAATGTETICLLGATTADRLVGVNGLAAAGVDVRIATDDGTDGHHGFCTDLIEENAEGVDYIAVCGPGPMEVAAAREIEVLRGVLSPDVVCEVSMERRMACGVGACLSCVVETVAGRKRACVDGPVFEMSEVIW